MNPTTPPKPWRGCSVIELRQYEMQPGRRDELIMLFEREFIDTQESVGLQVLGTLCDADAPDRFVWLRGFADMRSRLAGLQAFYGGPVWQQHRNAANATMVDSDNVLLLQPLVGDVSVGAAGATGVWQVLICPLLAPWSAADTAHLPTADVAWFSTHPADNNFPRLPVRSGHWLMALAPQPPLLPDVLQARLAATPTRLRLLPTPRSALR